MKQKDIASLVLIAAISALISYFLSTQFLTPSANRSQQVEVVEEISSEFQRPSEKYFNPESNNPTQIIQISPNENTEPIGSQ